MSRRYQLPSQPPSDHVRILLDVDKQLLGEIDALAESLGQSRQALLLRFIEEGLEREGERG